MREREENAWLDVQLVRVALMRREMCVPQRHASFVCASWDRRALRYAHLRGIRKELKFEGEKEREKERDVLEFARIRGREMLLMFIIVIIRNH